MNYEELEELCREAYIEEDYKYLDIDGFNRKSEG